MEQEAIMSTEVAALTEALSKAQGEFSNVKKNDEAKGSFTYKYANLADCLKEIRSVLSNHGMSFTQLVNHNKMYTTIHYGNQWIRSINPIEFNAMKSSTNPIQDYGKILSYIKRYAIMGLVGLSSTDDDNDSNVSNERPKFDSEKHFNRISDELLRVDSNEESNEEKAEELINLWKKEKGMILRLDKNHQKDLTKQKDILKDKYIPKKIDLLTEALESNNG